MRARKLTSHARRRDLGDLPLPNLAWEDRRLRERTPVNAMVIRLPHCPLRTATKRAIEL